MAHMKIETCIRCGGNVKCSGWQPKDRDWQGNPMPYVHQLELPASCQSIERCEAERKPYALHASVKT